MAKQLTYMTGEDFVRKILDGETDFRDIRLEQGVNLAEIDGYKGIRDRFKDKVAWSNETYRVGTQRVGEVSLESIDVSGSELRYCKAAGLYLPGIQAKETDFEGSYLQDAKFSLSVFSGANLTGVDLSRADLIMAYLKGADLENADLHRTDLTGAILNGALNLDKAKNLGQAYLENTFVSPEQAEIIDDARKTAYKIGSGKDLEVVFKHWLKREL